MIHRTRGEGWLDALRGAAIVGVVAVHTSAHFAYANKLTPVIWANIAVDVLAHYAVPLFLLLSGLGLTLRYGAAETEFSAGRFYARRLSRVIPPYLVFSLLYLLLFAIEYGPPAPSWIPLALLSASGYYHLWFVALLVQLYLLFPLLRRIVLVAGAKRHTGLLLLVTLFLQLAWNLGAPLLASVLPDRPLFQAILSPRFVLSHIFYFALGMVAALNVQRFERRIRILPAAPLIVAVAALAGGTLSIWIWAIGRYGSLDASPAATFLPAVAAEPLLFLSTIILLWKLALRLPRGEGTLASGLTRLGGFSFTIYLVHVLFQWALARWMAPFGVTPVSWGFYPVMFFGTLALSYAAAEVFSRLPYGQTLAGAPRAEVTRTRLLRQEGVEGAGAE